MDMLQPYDAARMLGVTASTLRRWAAAGRIRAVQTPGGHHRYPRTELDRLRGGL